MITSLETAREILSRPPEPVMPEHARFALVERPADPFCKPKVYTSADDLGRALHVRRAARPIMLVNAALKVANETTARRGVSVWAINLDDQPGEYLGWVFIGGLQRRELSELLDRLDPDQPREAEAA